jgi:hypothetical protein
VARQNFSGLEPWTNQVSFQKNSEHGCQAPFPAFTSSWHTLTRFP